MTPAEPSLGHLHPSCRDAMKEDMEGPVCGACAGDIQRAMDDVIVALWGYPGAEGDTGGCE